MVPGDDRSLVCEPRQVQLRPSPRLGAQPSFPGQEWCVWIEKEPENVLVSVLLASKGVRRWEIIARTACSQSPSLDQALG